jgi:hypothetical protein
VSQSFWVLSGVMKVGLMNIVALDSMGSMLMDIVVG